MLGCRVLYALALVGAFLFHVFYTDYFSLYVLILVLLFPLFSLLVSLPGMLGCSVSLTTGGQLRRGERGWCALRLKNRWSMPVARATAVVECVNLLTGERRVFRERFSGCSGGGRIREVLDCPHCGCLRFTLRTWKVCDLLGLFSIRRPVPEAVEALVLPTPLPPELMEALSEQTQESVRLIPRPGGGPGEDYDLRPYRPGDPIRSVHWKLSSKLDALVVRETLEPQQTALLLTFDHFGPIAGLDEVLSQLEALSRALLERNRVHYVQWPEPGHTRPRQCRIADEAGLYACLKQVCSTPAPAAGRSLLDLPPHVEGVDTPVRRIHLAPPEEEAAP